MMMSKTCNRTMNGVPVTWEHVQAEWVELMEAKTWKELKEETSDVLYFWYCYLQQAKGINLYMLGAGRTIKKIKKRIVIWEMIFAEHGLPFNLKYLKYGSNHNKPEKVIRALALAIDDCGIKE